MRHDSFLVGGWGGAVHGSHNMIYLKSMYQNLTSFKKVNIVHTACTNDPA